MDAIDHQHPSSRVTLALEYRGPLGGLLARLTRDITERYLAFEANGLKARSENAAFHHAGHGRTVAGHVSGAMKEAK